MKRITKYRLTAILSWCLLYVNYGFAQTKAELKSAKKLYGGNWVNNKTHRHLSISFDNEDYATINDWQGKWDPNSNAIDAYKAFIHQNKLIMGEDKTDLRAPYCEILKQGDKLLYRCRGMFTKSKRFVEQYIYVRE